MTLLRAGRFKYIVLSRWDADQDEWAELRTFEADDL